MRSRLGMALAAMWLLMATAGGVAADTLEQIKARGTVIVAAMPDALPQSGYDGAGKLAGFDIDVAKAIASRMGVDATFVTPTWQEVLAGDWNGRWDMCVCSMTPTKAREEKLAFPDVYRLSPATLVVHKDNTTIMQPADASGKAIGVKADTTYESYLAQNLTIYAGGTDIDYAIDNAEVVEFPDKQTAMAALAEGDGVKLDAVITSLEHAQRAVGEGLPVRILGGFLFFEPLAVTTMKDDAALGAAIQAAVVGLEQDGTLSKLSEKWFGIDLTSQ